MSATTKYSKPRLFICSCKNHIFPVGFDPPRSAFDEFIKLDYILFNKSDLNLVFIAQN